MKRHCIGRYMFLFSSDFYTVLSRPGPSLQTLPNQIEHTQCRWNSSPKLRHVNNSLGIVIVCDGRCNVFHRSVNTPHACTKEQFMRVVARLPETNTTQKGTINRQRVGFLAHGYICDKFRCEKILRTECIVCRQNIS
jgi:hypothetical protein